MGKVILVGAGAGDTGLLTIKGKKYIEEADCIIYDRLASPELLGMAKHGCECIYVGKENHKHIMKQDAINELLYKKSREYSLVVRLKGGDPYVFGRGGEEALYLRKKKIDIEVVPGVSSVVAALADAGIPITHRGIAKGFQVITAHSKKDEEAQIDYTLLTDESMTCVFRMDLADACRQETVAGDGEEDARLTEEIDDERRDDAGNGADGDEIGHARPVEDTQGMGDRFRRIQVRIVDGTGQGEGHGDVEAHTDEDRKNDANRQVAFRFLTFFSRCGDGVKAHVREEDNGRTAQDTLDAEGCEGVEVGHFHMRCGDADEGDDGGQGDEDQGRIQFSTLFCPADQDQGQQEDDDDCRKIDDASFSRGL